jgi:hypothetical protein
MYHTENYSSQCLGEVLNLILCTSGKIFARSAKSVDTRFLEQLKI